MGVRNDAHHAVVLDGIARVAKAGGGAWNKPWTGTDCRPQRVPVGVVAKQFGDHRSIWRLHSFALLSFLTGQTFDRLDRASRAPPAQDWYQGGVGLDLSLTVRSQCRSRKKPSRPAAKQKTAFPLPRGWGKNKTGAVRSTCRDGPINPPEWHQWPNSIYEKTRGLVKLAVKPLEPDVIRLHTDH
jgi:hypothetical protein